MTHQHKIKEFNELLEEILSSLLRFAYSRCIDKTLAEDLVQDTCLKAYKAYIEEGKEILKFKEWVFKILINTHISYLRKQRPETYSDLNFEEIANKCEQRISTINFEVKEDINHALSFLNEEQREVIYLVEIEGYSFKEAAEILGIPFGTLASRLQRGRIKLRSLLLDMGYGEKKYAMAGKKHEM